MSWVCLPRMCCVDRSLGRMKSRPRAVVLRSRPRAVHVGVHVRTRALVRLTRRRERHRRWGRFRGRVSSIVACWGVRGELRVWAGSPPAQVVLRHTVVMCARPPPPGEVACPWLYFRARARASGVPWGWPLEGPSAGCARAELPFGLPWARPWVRRPRAACLSLECCSQLFELVYSPALVGGMHVGGWAAAPGKGSRTKAPQELSTRCSTRRIAARTRQAPSD